MKKADKIRKIVFSLWVLCMIIIVINIIFHNNYTRLLLVITHSIYAIVISRIVFKGLANDYKIVKKKLSETRLTNGNKPNQ
jgi:hypothetical protein